jgi:hypothetical protein
MGVAMMLALNLPEAVLHAGILIAAAIVVAAVIAAKILAKPLRSSRLSQAAAAFPSAVDLPQSEEGRPVEPSEVPVDSEARLEVGSTVLAFGQGRWWRVEVIGLEPGGRVRIHFPGWDAVVPREALQVDLHRGR